MTKRPYYGKTDDLVRNIRGIILTYLMARFRLGRLFFGCGCLLVAVVSVCGLLAVMGLLRP